MRLASLLGSARLDASLPPADLPGFIGCTPDPQAGLPGSIVPLAGVLAQLRPRAGTTQCCFVRLVASLPTGDVTLILSDLTAGFSWEEGLTDAVAFSFTVPASSGDWLRGPLGYETTWNAPPPGLSRLRLDLVYVTAAGAEAVYTLVTSGIAQRSRRRISRDGHLLQIDALGTWARYDRRPVTLSLPPRHGQTHGQVARALAALAGVPAGSIAVPPGLGAPRLAALDIVREQFRSAVGTVGEALNHVLDFDRAGRFVAFDLVPDAPPEWVFTLDQLAATSELGMEADGEVVTCVTVTGTSPERADSALGSVTTIEMVETFAIFAIPGAYFRQQGDGSLAAAGSGPLPATFQLVSRVTTKRTTVHGCLHEEQVITEGFYAPEAARYSIEADGDLDAQPSVYLYDSGAVAFDGAKAYFWQRHRFVEISRVITRYAYDEIREELERTLIYRRAWFNRPAALKHRTDPLDTWEVTPYIDGTLITGDGAGVLYQCELYHIGWNTIGAEFVNPVSLEVTLARSTEFKVHRAEGGYLVREETEQRDFFSPAGGEYLYQSDATPSQFPEHQGGISGRVETVYSAVNSGGLTTIMTKFDARGALDEQVITKSDGDRPAVPRCDEGDEDRKSGRPWSVKRCAGTGSHVVVEEETSNDFIETEAEAESYIVRRLRRAQAHTATLSVPVNGALVRGMSVRLYFPEAGIDLSGWIEKHSISKGARGGPMLSEITLKLRTF